MKDFFRPKRGFMMKSTRSISNLQVFIRCYSYIHKNDSDKIDISQNYVGFAKETSCAMHERSSLGDRKLSDNTGSFGICSCCFLPLRLCSSQ